MFCQLEILRHCFPPSVRRILEELPDSLDETYERILREIRKPNHGHAHRLLQCLVVSVRPLKVKELAEILAFDFNTEGIPELNLNWRWEDQEEAVMSACSSLITIVKDGESRVVQFSHFSVKEFLTANRLAEPIRDVSHYHVRPDAAHTILAQACLGVLLRLDDRVALQNIWNFPLALYAAEYWARHARFGNVSSRVKAGMECLFDEDKPHFATWLWIYNDDRPRSRLLTEFPKKPEAVPLYYAAGLGFRDLTERFIAKHPLHVNARGGREVTAMHIAAKGGHVNILSLLLEHGANVDDQGDYGQTPLHRASWSGEVDAGQFLLDCGADINARDNADWTPLFRAVFNGHVEFARMLIRRGAVINLRDAYGKSPLHLAVRREEVQAVRLLLEHGADVNARNRHGQTPSQTLNEYTQSWQQQQEIVQLLSLYSATPVQ